MDITTSAALTLLPVRVLAGRDELQLVFAQPRERASLAVCRSHQLAESTLEAREVVNMLKTANVFSCSGDDARFRSRTWSGTTSDSILSSGGQRAAIDWASAQVGALLKCE